MVFGQKIRYPPDKKRFKHSEAQRAAYSVGVAPERERLRFKPEELVGVHQEILASGRKGHVLADAVEEKEIQLIFQLFYLDRHRRLGIT